MRFTRIFAAVLVSFGLATLGCEGDVGTTDDSTRMEVEIPKVETGEEDLDLDPRTDGDVDIDTPREGDT